MKVSIIIPVYNVEKYLVECIESCLNQSLEDIEIICINDGSTDSSLEILNKYQMVSDKINVLSQENQGLGAVRNKGVSLAKGEFIFFLDSDDLIEPDTMKKLYDIAKENRLDILITGFKIYAESKVKKLNKNFSVVTKETLTGEEYLELQKDYNGVIWNKLWRRDFVLEHDLKNFVGRYYEDLLFSINGILKAQKVMNIDYYPYYYRMSEGSIVRRRASVKHMTDLYECRILFLDKKIKKYNIEALKNMMGRVLFGYLKTIYRYRKLDKHTVRNTMRLCLYMLIYLRSFTFNLLNRFV